jgi:serine/threonine protein kinase
VDEEDGDGLGPLPSGEWLGPDDSGPATPAESRYRERSVLGEGGMGKVVAAEDLRLRREVALKWALGNPDGPEAQRLRREARITAALDHPGIVPVYDLGEGHDGRPFYVMRLVRGGSLSEAIERSSSYLERSHLVRNLLSACEAVAFAHAAGVVHRDIKPDNILVGPYGETQVMDWGLARTLDEDDWAGVSAPRRSRWTPPESSSSRSTTRPTGGCTSDWRQGPPRRGRGAGGAEPGRASSIPGAEFEPRGRRASGRYVDGEREHERRRLRDLRPGVDR